MRLAKDKPITYRGKVVGIIKKNRTYVSHRNKNHWFRKFNGFGMSASVLKELRQHDVETIKVIYTKVDDTQEIWMAKVNDFYEKGVIWKDIEFDYQRVLNQKYWKVIK